MIGPFDCIPFPNVQVAISPLSTHLKKDSVKRRVILDCSWPIGYSLNDGIDKDSYLSKPIKLTYPMVDHLAKRIHQLKKQGVQVIFLFKEDMDHAFR